MPAKKKYKYDIRKIEALENKGFSVRAAARMLGIPMDSTQKWINRNYKKVVSVRYEKLI